MEARQAGREGGRKERGPRSTPPQKSDNLQAARGGRRGVVSAAAAAARTPVLRSFPRLGPRFSVPGRPQPRPRRLYVFSHAVIYCS